MPELALFEIQMKFFAFLLACISAGMFMLMPKFFFTSCCISRFCLLGLVEMVEARCSSSASSTSWRSFSGLSFSLSCCGERAEMRMTVCGEAFSLRLSPTENSAAGMFTTMRVLTSR